MNPTEDANVPKCPKCGSEMVGGAPHGPWPVQYECRRCGTITTPTAAESLNRIRHENYHGYDDDYDPRG